MNVDVESECDVYEKRAATRLLAISYTERAEEEEHRAGRVNIDE